MNQNLVVSWLPRHRQIAAKMKGGPELLAYAEKRPVLEQQGVIVAAGGKPVIAYADLLAGLGLTVAELAALKRFAGEIAAHAVETVFGAVRAAGSKTITGHAVFKSAQPFRLPARPPGRVGAGSPDRFMRVFELLIGLAKPDELQTARGMIDRAMA